MKICGLPLAFRSQSVSRCTLPQPIRSIHTKKHPVFNVPKGQFPKSRMLGDQLVLHAQRKDIRTGNFLKQKRPSQPQETQFTTFNDLQIPSSFADSLAEQGIKAPTEIQVNNVFCC